MNIPLLTTISIAIIAPTFVSDHNHWSLFIYLGAHMFIYFLKIPVHNKKNGPYSGLVVAISNSYTWWADAGG